MSSLPKCPQCSSEYTYEDGPLYICPECAHEWPRDATPNAEESRVVRDAHGNVLADGDDVVLIKDLKLKGSSSSIKGGTKIKRIKLVDGDHEIDCKVDGMAIMLKAQFVKKA